MLLVIDNFLDQEDNLLYDIQHDRYWLESLPYKFMDKDSDNRVDVWQKMATKIWSHVSRYGVLPEEYAGVEYWNNIMSIPGNRQDLPWHFDKDEHLYNTAGELKTPYIGSVYYAHKFLPSEGYLEIKRGENMCDVERIQPVPNRLVIFDSGTVHRVTHITSGMRRCFATNIWIDKPCEENFV